MKQSHGNAVVFQLYIALLAGDECGVSTLTRYQFVDWGLRDSLLQTVLIILICHIAIMMLYLLTSQI